MRRRAALRQSDRTGKGYNRVIPIVYKKVQTMRRLESQHGSLGLNICYITDIFLQDCNVQNAMTDMYDMLLTAKDNIDSGLSSSFSARQAVKTKTLKAFLKVAYYVYKFVIYKWMIHDWVNDHDSSVKMLIDYVNLYFDHVIE